MVLSKIFGTPGSKQDYGTPRWLFDGLDHEFGFTLDVCASADNAKCERYFSGADGGLNQEWSGACWVNPPFRGAGKWIERAYYAAKIEDATVVCLVPVWSHLYWWHDYALRATEIRFLKGRITFEDSTKALPTPIAIVIYRPGQLDGEPKLVSAGRP